jgi:NTE family protein
LKSPWFLLAVALGLPLAGHAATPEPTPPGVPVASATTVPVASATADGVPACRARAVDPEGRPRIGLALGGGGARGIAHISVLRTLEELKVPIDCIAGTSMGSLVGALYASGMSVDEIEHLVRTIDWEQIFNDKLDRPEQSFRRKRDDDLVLAQPGIGVGSGGVRVAPGLLGGERILLTFAGLIEPVAAIDDFDDLPIPYRAVAADINTGEAVELRRGDLALAMRASMSIPGAFPPVPIDGRVLVDGGVAANLPVDAVRRMGADIVIAVDVGTPLATLESTAGILKVADQLTGLLTVGNTKATIASLGEHDVLIQPPLGTRVATADFTKVTEALAIGDEGVAVVRDRLAALGIAAPAYAQNRSVRTGRATEPPLVSFVRLENRTPYSDAFILARVKVPVGEPLDSARLEDQLFRLFGSRTLAQASYEVVHEDQGTGVVLHVKPKPQGPNYLEFGMSLASDFSGRSDFNVRLGVLGSPFNESGGEWRVLGQLGDEVALLGEVYLPMGEAGRYYLFGRTQYLDRKLDQFDADGNKLSEIQARQVGLQLAAGREFGNYGAVAVGYQRATGRADVLIGDPSTESVSYQQGVAAADFTIDRGDSLYFPRDGYLLRARYSISREALGADAEFDQFDQFDFDSFLARSFGRHSLQGGLRYHSTVSGVAPFHSEYRVGGFSRLVGYQPNERNGQHYAILLGGYSYRMAKLVNQPALVGVLLEHGNVWEDRGDIGFDGAVLHGSVYVGLDSWLGPILFGVGTREGGDVNAFLGIGTRF